MKIINLSSGLLHWYQSSTRCISVFSGQMNVMAINQLTQMPTNMSLNGWVIYSHSATILSSHDPSRVYLLYKDEQGCKLQTKQTEAKSEPGLITMNDQVVLLLDIWNQFKLISYIELNSIEPRILRDLAIVKRLSTHQSIATSGLRIPVINWILLISVFAWLFCFFLKSIIYHQLECTFSTRSRSTSKFDVLREHENKWSEIGNVTAKKWDLRGWPWYIRNAHITSFSRCRHRCDFVESLIAIG